jgi:hypothetical protein
MVWLVFIDIKIRVYQKDPEMNFKVDHLCLDEELENIFIYYLGQQPESYKRVDHRP